MSKITPQSLLGFIFSALLVLAVVFLDPSQNPEDIFGSFNKNYDKSYYFEHCVVGAEHINQTTTDSSSTSSPISGTSTLSTLLHVVEVSDGDTILVSKNCEPVKVRMIGIDTPETVDPRKPVQCFGKEASDYTKKHLQGKSVVIETDAEQDTYDKYGRLLGYVILEDGTNFNKTLIEEGYAHEYTYQTPYRYQKEFKEAEQSARENQRGLWNLETCAGNTKS